MITCVLIAVACVQQDRIKSKSQADTWIFASRRNKCKIASDCLLLFIPRILPDKVKGSFSSLPRVVYSALVGSMGFVS